MFVKLLRKIKALLRRESVTQSPRTDRQAVEQDIHADIDMTFGYFLSLIIANLIALVGVWLIRPDRYSWHESSSR